MSNKIAQGIAVEAYDNLWGNVDIIDKKDADKLFTEMENYYKAVIPEEFKQFILKCNGANEVSRCIIESGKHSNTIEKIFNFRHYKSASTASVSPEDMKEMLLKPNVPFCSMGHEFCIYNLKTKKVTLVETNESVPLKLYMIPLGSLNSFLNGLKTGRENDQSQKDYEADKKYYKKIIKM